MDLRKLIVGLLAAGTLTLGVTGIGVAGAEEAYGAFAEKVIDRV